MLAAPPGLPRLALEARVRVAQDGLADVVEAVDGVEGDFVCGRVGREGRLEGLREVGLGYVR